jgi:hypothetical protein
VADEWPEAFTPARNHGDLSVLEWAKGRRPNMASPDAPVVHSIGFLATAYRLSIPRLARLH